MRVTEKLKVMKVDTVSYELFNPGCPLWPPHGKR